MIKKYKKLLVAISLIVCLLFLGQIAAPALTTADRLESSNYVIQFGNFNMGSGKRQGSNYTLSYTLGQTAAGPYGAYQGDPANTNYFIGSGFQYIYPFNEFSFTISDTDLDFGILYSGVFSNVSNQLTITTEGAGGYSVYAYELYPLMHQDGSDYIPDTTCDSSYTCDETEAKPWTDANQAGFGFNAQGDTVSSDFTSADIDCDNNSECFRQFADNSSSENMQVVMESSNVADEDTATIDYQVTIDADQAAGTYETGIVYVAVPGY